MRMNRRRRGGGDDSATSAVLESTSSMTAFLHRPSNLSNHNRRDNQTRFDNGSVASSATATVAGSKFVDQQMCAEMAAVSVSSKQDEDSKHNPGIEVLFPDSAPAKPIVDDDIPAERGSWLGSCCRRTKAVDDEDKVKYKPWMNDYISASLVGRLVFSWCAQLEKETLKREVDTDDLWTILPSQKCDVVTERVRKTWSKELELLTTGKLESEATESTSGCRCWRRQRQLEKPLAPSLARAIFYAFAAELRRVAFFKLLWLVAILLSNALFFNSTLRVLQEFSNGTGQQPVVYAGSLAVPYIGFFWAFAFGFSDVCRSLFINAHWWTASIAGLKARIAVSNLVFEKLSKLRQVESVGGVVTHTTNDTQRIMDALTYGIFIVSTPTAMIAIVIIGSFYLSAAFAIGLALLILFLPIQVRIGGLSQKYHRQTVKISSERVTLMSEILRAIKLVKLYGWGKSFSLKVNKVRDMELRNLLKGATVRATNQSISFTTPTLVVACAFAFHTLVLDKPLVASEAFTAVALLNAARFPLSILPQATRCLSEAMVACKRLEKFLLSTNEHQLARSFVSDFSSSSKISPLTPSSSFVMASYQEDAQAGTVRFKGSPLVELPLQSGNVDVPSLTTTSAITPSVEDATSPTTTEVNGEETCYGNNEDEIQTEYHHEDEYAVVMQNCQFTWWKDGDDAKSIRERPAQLVVPSLRIPKNKITLMIGKLGSGKSSVLAGAILGEMILKEGSNSVFELSSNRIAYVAQNPFIFNGTVRENILMNEPEDPERLQQVIDACALEPDLKQFPAGLETELGERGINGSGGQKSRIALARALYASVKVDMIILDDVLSAVDAHVKHHLWRTIRLGPLLENKTIILATHCGEIFHESDYLIRCVDGTVDDVVTFQQISESEEKLNEFLDSVGCTLEPVTAGADEGTEGEEESKDTRGEKADDDERPELPTTIEPKEFPRSKEDAPPPQQQRHDGTLVQREVRATGNVQFSTIKKMLFRRDAICFSLLSISMLIINEASIALGTGLWITAWTQNFFHQSSEFYVAGLFGITLGILVLSEIRGLMFSRMMLTAARSIHADAFRTLMQAKLSFFDVTPMGRILSRFSGDLDIMDVLLPDVVETSVSLLIRSFFSFIMIAIVFVWFLIPMAVLLGIFVSFFMRFRPSLRMMKRIDATARSPILSLVESTASGLTTLRAFGQLEATRKRAREDFDLLFKTALAFNATSRYMAVRLDMITSASTVTTACLCVLFASQASPGLAGLALTSILQTGGVFQFAIRQLMEAESMFSSVERLVQFSETVPKEDDVIITGDSPSPPDGGNGSSLVNLVPQTQTGEIVFDHVYARYRSRLPFVLKGMSFTIQAKTSCGLVGRTGSGKSSCLLALFRIFKIAQGEIRIDGTNIASIPLEHLRSKVLSIIPQDPSLFKGTLRSNLDPLDEHSDAELRFALENVHLRLELKDGLDHVVDEAGGNLSQGERQLFCLARALLRKTPIVCLDEATSSIDSSTSKVLGETIKDLFRDRTLLIVAHRLDVVSSLDQVCVLEAGECIEQGDPRKLIQQAQGPFFDLWVKHQNAPTSSFPGAE